MGMILRIASSRIVGQGDIVGRSGYFSLNLSANSVMRGRLDARRTLKSLVADLRVKIKGEAFFEVTPNSEQPFIVDASGLSVKVLGTSFSVQTSDQGNEISVILVEGKVSLNNAHEKELVQLHPNQKADYFVNDEHYTVTEVDSERLTSWRKGIIFYDNASLDEIVRLIEQTYKVSLMYTRPENDDQRFSGAFLKTQKLETVLQQTNKLTGTNLILIQ